MKISDKCKKAERELIDAVLNDDPRVVGRLLDSSLSLNTRDPEHEETLLMLARSEPMTRLLIDRGADVDAQDDHGWTALVYTKHPSALLAAGADPNIPDKQGDTALMHAIARADFARVEALIAHGADVNHANHHGETPLMLARNYGLLSLVNTLLSAGAAEKPAP